MASRILPRRYVRSGPPVPPAPLPRPEWHGKVYVEADGTVNEVVWTGHRDGPTLCGVWPCSGHSSLNAMIDLHLRHGR